MAEVENKSAETPQNEEKKVKGYKVTSGSFESKIEAAGKVREANNKGSRRQSFKGSKGSGINSGDLRKQVKKS